MDGNGNINLRNWGFIDPSATSLKRNMELHFITSMAEKPLFGGGGVRNHLNAQPSPVMASINGGPFHHHNSYLMSPNRDKFINVMPGNHHHAYYQPNFGVSPETMPQPVSMQKSENVVPEMEEMCEEMDEGEGGSGAAVVKKRRGGKVADSAPKEKKPRTKTPRAPRDEPAPSQRARTPKKRAEIVINGINMDVSEIPTPVCSCTGTPQQCYRWGSGGWQSACCTTGLSVYPLPMSTKRRGARIAGRKMSIGAFKKVLEKLSSEGYNFSSPIDLRSHWAKHGTNKFVTIR